MNEKLFAIIDVLLRLSAAKIEFKKFNYDN